MYAKSLQYMYFLDNFLLVYIFAIDERGSPEGHELVGLKIDMDCSTQRVAQALRGMDSLSYDQGYAIWLDCCLPLPH